MTFSEFVDATYDALRARGMDTRTAFYAVKNAGGCRQAYDANDTPTQYVERITR